MRIRLKKTTTTREDLVEEDKKVQMQTKQRETIMNYKTTLREDNYQYHLNVISDIKNTRSMSKYQIFYETTRNSTSAEKKMEAFTKGHNHHHQHHPILLSKMIHSFIALILVTLITSVASQLDNTQPITNLTTSTIITSSANSNRNLLINTPSIPAPLVAAPGQLQAQSNANVIIIKYANVSSKHRLATNLNSDDNSQDHIISDNIYNFGDSNNNLNIFKLAINEPLSVSVIESKFAHSISLFDVSQNQLSTLSNNLFCPLSNEVRLLNVSHNLLENFDSLGLISQTGQLCLNELRILDMSFNLIKHLPATGVASLHNLEILNLSNNLIESLDELSLSSLFRLTKLDLSYNRIQQLPIVLFQKSYSMQILKLQSNQLQITINQTFLAGLISLEELNLSQNNISHIADFSFIDKTNLTRVDLTHNKLSTLRQDALRVTTSTKQAPLSSSSNNLPSITTRQRIYHNGQYANTPRQTLTTTLLSPSANAEFYLSSNPFTCDCQLEWLRNFQQPSAMKTTVLGSSPSSQMMKSRFNPTNLDPFGAQLMHLSGNIYQNDQPPVIQTSDSSNNISEILSGVNNQPGSDSPSSKTMATLMSSSQQPHHQHQQQHHHVSQQYAKIGDLDLIKCAPLFRRNSHRSHQQQQHHHDRHRSGHNQNRAQAPSDGGHYHNGGHHGHYGQARYQHDTMIDLLTADSSNFLCRYKSHCFALCHCCEFDACDCEMICPNGCNCYYDLTWKTNIIDCSSNNHTVVPDRIPMDVTGLYLDGNNIDSLKPSNLIARKSLKSLYLNSSNLQYIANRTFNGLIELQTLYLNDNILRSLQGHEFEPLSQLKALYLQSNRLEFINNQTFIYLRSLEILDLSNNRLTSNSLDLFWSIGHHNIRLRQLNIAHNWWSCQCSSINRFRQILKHKFLLNGGVNIADKNQLRCYYNSTTVGPLILHGEGVGLSMFQQPLYGSSYQQQQTLLTEINQCSEFEEIPKYPQDINPPLIINSPLPDILNPSAEGYPPTDGYEQPTVSDPNGQYTSGDRYPNPQAPNSDQQDMYPPNLMPNIIGSNGVSTQRGSFNNSSNGMPLSFILLCMLCIVILIIAASIFVFVRQQQQSFNQSHHHKKSSAASTTSASSSASSTAISSLNGVKSHRSHHHNTTLQYPHHHHLIMSNGSHGATTTSINHQTMQQHNHHHHSASSQSNIYAALVSPTTGNSTTVTNPAASMNNNNLYSNSSTTASHHSSTPSQLANNNAAYHQATQNWASQHSNINQQIYNQTPYSGGINIGIENHYTIKGSSQASYKMGSGVVGSGGSLYNSGLNCHNGIDAGSTGASAQQQQQNNADWMRLPKVKQFMSKLVNKSLALGRYRAVSRDELSAITSDKIYDAFMSYDKRDEAFVMQHLSAELEYGQPQYRVADRFRDLPLPTSAYIAEAITSVIGCSHRTIVVLTENYLSSDWCRYELQAALNEANMNKSHKIIAVVLDPNCLLDMDNEMRSLLTNCQLYQQGSQAATVGGAPNNMISQLVHLDKGSTGGNQMVGSNEQQLIASLQSANQIVSSTAQHQQQQQQQQTAQLATSKITFINYNDRKFWQNIKQLMPLPRPSTQTLTLTTKN